MIQRSTATLQAKAGIDCNGSPLIADNLLRTQIGLYLANISQMQLAYIARVLSHRGMTMHALKFPRAGGTSKTIIGKLDDALAAHTLSEQQQAAGDLLALFES